MSEMELGILFLGIGFFLLPFGIYGLREDWKEMKKHPLPGRIIYFVLEILFSFALEVTMLFGWIFLLSILCIVVGVFMLFNIIA